MNKFILAIKDLIIASGLIALEIRKNDLQIDYKSDKSPVTNADKAISEFIYSNLTLLDNNIPIICEERDYRSITTDKIWLIDPIDGTKSYIKGEDTYTVNIALIENHIPILGFIYQPSSKKLYYSDKNGKLHIEQDAIAIEPTIFTNPQSYKAVISSNNSNSQTNDFLKTHNVSDILPIASSIKFCLIAEGKADLYPKFGDTMEWDVAAGHAIVKAAGGFIKNIHGIELTYCSNDQFLNPHFIAYGKNVISIING